jgi:hypothetical protein
LRYALPAALLAALLIAGPVHAEWRRSCTTDGRDDQLSCWVSLGAIRPDGTELTLHVLMYRDRVRVMVTGPDDEPLVTPATLRVDRNAPWISERPRGSHAMFLSEESDAIAYELRQGKAAIVRTQVGAEPAFSLRFNLSGSAQAIEGARRELITRGKPAAER